MGRLTAGVAWRTGWSWRRAGGMVHYFPALHIAPDVFLRFRPACSIPGYHRAWRFSRIPEAYAKEIGLQSLHKRNLNGG